MKWAGVIQSYVWYNKVRPIVFKAPLSVSCISRQQVSFKSSDVLKKRYSTINGKSAREYHKSFVSRSSRSLLFVVFDEGQVWWDLYWCSVDRFYMVAW